jgi:integrase/recombinase XerD
MRGGFFMDNNKLLIDIDNFMLDCSARNLSRKTMASYEQTLRLFTTFIREKYGITDSKSVKARHIREYIEQTRQRGKYTVVADAMTSRINHPTRRSDYGKQVSETTLANYLRNIKVFFNYLYGEKIIRRNPVANIENIKPARKKKPLLAEHELYMLMRSFDTSTFHGFRDWTITRLILDSGPRISEVLSIMPADVDLRNRAILLRYTKGGKERFIYFSDKMGRNLKSWMEFADRYTNSPYLFPSIHGRKMDPRNFEMSLRRAGQSVGIDVAPHQLRNNFAKYYLLNGGDFATLSRILGHSSPEVTQRAYLDFTNREIGQNYQKHSPLENLKI